MTPQTLKRIMIVLVVLLALWGVSEALTKRSDKVMGGRIFPALEAASVDSIVVKRKTDTVRLVRQPKFWTVNGHLGSATEMDGFFKQLADTTAPEIAAQN